MKNPSKEFIPTRASLLTRLKHWDDQESWKVFFDTYWRLLYSVARKAGLADAAAQDVVQETIIAVAKAMPEFKYDPSLGSFKGWLMQLTRRRIIDHLRKRHYHQQGQEIRREETLRTEMSEGHTDPLNLDGIWEDEWNKQVLAAALERVRGYVSPGHFQIFYFHVMKQMQAKEVAATLQVKLPEVYFAKYKVGRLLKKEIKALERKMF